MLQHSFSRHIIRPSFINIGCHATNMNSILKTVEDAYDEVDHLVTKTILKFIGLKMTQKCLPKLLRVIVDQAKEYSLRALRLPK